MWGVIQRTLQQLIVHAITSLQDAQQGFLGHGRTKENWPLNEQGSPQQILRCDAPQVFPTVVNDTSTAATMPLHAACSRGPRIVQGPVSRHSRAQPVARGYHFSRVRLRHVCPRPDVPQSHPILHLIDI